MSIAEKTWFTNKQFLIILISSIGFTASTVFGGAMFYYTTQNTTEENKEVKLELENFKDEVDVEFDRVEEEMEEGYDYLNNKISKKSNEDKDMIRANTKLIIELKTEH